jgi:hypothetical protein
MNVHTLVNTVREAKDKLRFVLRKEIKTRKRLGRLVYFVDKRRCSRSRLIELANSTCPQTWGRTPSQPRAAALWSQSISTL